MPSILEFLLNLETEMEVAVYDTQDCLEVGENSPPNDRAGTIMRRMLSRRDHLVP